jgi:hypothetical protein
MAKSKSRIITISVLLIAIVFLSTAIAQQGNTISRFSDTQGQLSLFPEVVEVTLAWKPSREIRATPDMDLMLLQRKKIEVKLFNDLRNNKNEIGSNIEKKFTDKNRLVTTKDSVAAWLTSSFTDVLSDLNVSTTKEQGEAFLSADIQKLFVKEDRRYSATILLKMRLLTREGAVLWEDIIIGTSNNWGAFFKKDNYLEGLSDACIDSANNLVRNEGFKAALRQIK